MLPYIINTKKTKTNVKPNPFILLNRYFTHSFLTFTLATQKLLLFNLFPCANITFLGKSPPNTS